MLLSPRITEEWTYLVRANSSQWNAVPLRAACANKLNRAVVIHGSESTWNSLAWFAVYAQILCLPKTEWPHSWCLLGTALGWSLLQTILKLCLGNCYLGQSKAMPWSILTSRTDDRMPVLEFRPGPFWFAGRDEVDGISTVGTFSLHNRWLSYFLRQSYPEF